MSDIKWIGSPNFWHGRTDKSGKTWTPFAIVNHIMCGSEGGTDAWFQNPKSGVSAHYGIAKDGTIHQYVKTEDTAWAVGIVNKPTSPFSKQFPGVNPNYYTISIEYEGQPNDGLTEAQYQSGLWLHTQLMQKFPDIKVDRDHITGHFSFDSVNRSDCPGPKFPWERLLKDLSPVPPDFDNGYSGFNDDVLWGLENGLLHTYVADGTLRRQNPINREQAINMLHQYHIKMQKGEIK